MDDQNWQIILDKLLGSVRSHDEEIPQRTSDDDCVLY